jgi:hypothetical protein
MLPTSPANSATTIRAVKLCEKNDVTETKATRNTTSKLIINQHENISVALYYWKNIGVPDCKF